MGGLPGMCRIGGLFHQIPVSKVPKCLAGCECVLFDIIFLLATVPSPESEMLVRNWLAGLFDTNTPSRTVKRGRKVRAVEIQIKQRQVVPGREIFLIVVDGVGAAV